ncbi:hypothetical protein TNIN_95691, partial [Trichonephila inaurata madagascariensis]
PHIPSIQNRNVENESSSPITGYFLSISVHDKDIDSLCGVGEKSQYIGIIGWESCRD